LSEFETLRVTEKTARALRDVPNSFDWLAVPVKVASSINA